MRGARPRPEQATRIAATKAAKLARAECADCPMPARIKKNGKRARLCFACLWMDRERATKERDAVRAETAP